MIRYLSQNKDNLNFRYSICLYGDTISKTIGSVAGGVVSLRYATDYLGSVRAVVGGYNGTVYETSDYSAFGSRTVKSSVTPPAGVTLRDHYTGCEDLSPDFSLPYADHAARFYAPTLHRWMVPDPKSEDYYGVSVYSYCGGNPLNGVDPTGNYIFATDEQSITNIRNMLPQEEQKYLSFNNGVLDNGFLPDNTVVCSPLLFFLSILSKSDIGYYISSSDTDGNEPFYDVGDNSINPNHLNHLESGGLVFDEETELTVTANRTVPDNNILEAHIGFVTYLARKNYIKGR